MKKICIVTTVSSSIDNWFKPIFDDYKNLGVSVTVACNMSEDYEKTLNEKYPYIKTKSFPFPRGTSILGSIKSITLLKRFLKEEKFDYIQYHTPNAAFYTSIAAKRARIPIRVYGQWGIRYTSFSGIKRFIFKAIEKNTCKNSTHVKAQSFKNRQYNIDEGLCPAEKVDVIGIGGTIGVDFSEFDISKKGEYRIQTRKKLGLEDNDFLFGYIGRIHRDKGLNELIEAFSSVENAKLVLIGDLDKNYPPKQENLEKMKENKDIIYVDRIPRTEVAKYMSAFDVLVHPTYREGFGHVIQEAMTMALPVITTDIPGPSEVVENDISGILVPAKDSAALANEMKKIIMDGERRERYSVNARVRAERFFEQSIMVGHMMENYRKMLRL